MYRYGREEIEEIAKVIEARQLFRTGDPAAGHLQQVDHFEDEWAEKIGTEYALCVSGGGTGALLCGLVGLGIGPGDEVLVPAYTFMASALAVLAAGAIPVLTEIDDTLGIDPEDVERKIGPHTRAIMPVHMLGRPCDMDRIMRIARRHSLKVIEDACQCDGGSYKGRRAGSIGDAAGFSFNYYKIIGCGDGGAMVTNDRTTFERALIYHDGGTTFRPHARGLSVPIFAGIQLRASEIMGAMLRVQLQRLDGILADLRRNQRILTDELKDVAGPALAPNNDPAGDCGVVAAFRLETREQAERFVGYPGIGAGVLINSDRHVYVNWEPILEKRAGGHDALNPFRMRENQGLRMDYGRDDCPKTLEVLSRTACVSIDPDWTEEQAAEHAQVVRRAFESI